MIPLLEIKNVTFQYTGISASQGPVLSDIHFGLFANECTAICGPSGSGKTTLIQLFTGLLKPQSGQVLFQGQDIWSKGYSLAELRRQIGLVFQFPESQLFEETVFKDVAFGPKNLDLPEHEIEQRVLQALENVDLNPLQFKDRSPFRLSEGEKRRAAIAGVLAMGPDMVVFDEPTAGLDTKGIRRFQGIVQRLLAQKKTVVLVTHNMDFVAQVAGRVLVLVQGRLVFQGPPASLFKNKDLIFQAGLEPPCFMTAMESLALPPAFRGMISLDQLLQKIARMQNRKKKHDKPKNTTSKISTIGKKTRHTKRARQINNYFRHLGEGLGHEAGPQIRSASNKSLTLALEEIAADKLEFEHPDEGVK